MVYATWAYERIQCYVCTIPLASNLVMLTLDGLSVPVSLGLHRPLYRAWNGKDHFYTMSKSEYDNLPSQYNKEGVACYILNKQVGGHIPLYRLYKGSFDNHFYTTSDVEKNSVINAGYNDEGIVGYVRSDPSRGHVPLYRAYHPGIKDHFYTTDMAEIEAVAPKEIEAIQSLNIITDNQLRNCIRKRLTENGTIKYETCSDPQRLGYNTKWWFFGWHKSKTIHICTNNVSTGVLPGVILHEFAHSCCWSHNDGKGVPGNSGVI